MSLDSLHDLYVEELKDLYNAENQPLQALPRMAEGRTVANKRCPRQKGKKPLPSIDSTPLMT
jgi:hypothetical protein